ncbi:hypothetical protein V492_00894 [Pseudogymnoascus sp. VKM F-4246]|nr:hypothetical protein V492_00894 [Pseudogymnoascus sp. VKM F-4246]
MARQRRQKDVSSSDIPLAHPDKSGPDPSRQTLLNLAAERGLLDAEIQDRKAGKLPTGAVPLRAKPDEEPLIGRFGEAVLWSSSLAMLHFSLDVLTQHQYSEVLSWQRVITQSLQAFGVILVLFYALHPHSAPAAVFPRIPALLHQLIFFASSVGASPAVGRDLDLFVTPPTLNGAMNEEVGKYRPAWDFADFYCFVEYTVPYVQSIDVMAGPAWPTAVKDEQLGGHVEGIDFWDTRLRTCCQPERR